MQKLHPYIDIYTEEEEEEVNVSKNNFDDFIAWLILDGIKPKKSKRLWKKTILLHLLNDDKMTLENYYDYLEDRDETMKKITSKNNIDTFDYSIIINKIIITEDEKRKVSKYIDADSMIHLFFKDGSDLLVPKIDIQKSFGTKYGI